MFSSRVRWLHPQLDLHVRVRAAFGWVSARRQRRVGVWGGVDVRRCRGTRRPRIGTARSSSFRLQLCARGMAAHRNWRALRPTVPRHQCPRQEASVYASKILARGRPRTPAGEVYKETEACRKTNHFARDEGTTQNCQSLKSIPGVSDYSRAICAQQARRDVGTDSSGCASWPRRFTLAA